MNDPTPPAGPVLERRRGILTRLYHGETRIDFVGRAKLWLAISGLVIGAGLVSLVWRGLNLGIDFEGGTVWEVEANEASVADARDALEPLGLGGAEIQTLSSDEGVRLRVQAEPSDDPGEAREEQRAVADALASLAGVPADDVSINAVGPTWGEEISTKALRALVLFLVVVSIYITFRFELKMALATLAALVHDLLVTVGVYSLTGFEVTPATVIAILTILGYSIYDGIVVFDKVDENTRLVTSAGRMTYGDMVNRSLNQTLMRSLNTQITALLPMLSLLVIGALVLGATTLQEFALALLIGQASGAYSSIFIASPMLALLKEREPRYKELRRRLVARSERSETAEPSPVHGLEPAVPTGDPAGAAAAGAAGAVPTGVATGGDEAPGGRARAAGGEAVTTTRVSTNIPPRPRKKGKRR